MKKQRQSLPVSKLTQALIKSEYIIPKKGDALLDSANLAGDFHTVLTDMETTYNKHKEHLVAPSPK